MRKYNILFTSVGRRVELVQAFHKAAKELEIELVIVGVDMVETAPAMYFCDKKKRVCSIYDSRYITQLLDICKEEHVDCLIPTIDTDLILLAENITKFKAVGTIVLVSAADKIRLCRDKKLTSDYFHKLGLNAPVTVDKIENYDGGYPAFIKPIDGSSSINAYQVETINDLEIYAKRINNYIIQPYISGKEFTIDIFCDEDGNPVYITPRERLAVRFGEVMKTRICQNAKMIHEMLTLIKDFRPCGQITVQLIQDSLSGENYYIEINPRFGGGAPLSIKAGADSAKAVLQILMGEKLTFHEKAATDGAVYSRFDQSICVGIGVSDD